MVRNLRSTRDPEATDESSQFSSLMQQRMLGSSETKGNTWNNWPAAWGAAENPQSKSSTFITYPIWD